MNNHQPTHIAQLIKAPTTAAVQKPQQSLPKYLKSTEENEQFLIAHNPAELLTRITTDPLASVDTSPLNPELQELNQTHGRALTEDWLTLQLAECFTRCGFEFGTSADDAIRFCVTGILSRHKTLRLGEFALFLFRFQMGDFGEYYRTFTPQIFFTALAQFSRQRHQLWELKQKLEQR